MTSRYCTSPMWLPPNEDGSPQIKGTMLDEILKEQEALEKRNTGFNRAERRRRKKLAKQSKRRNR